MKNLPHLWKEGEVFTFSGLDGKTDWFNPLVLTLLKYKLGFLFEPEKRRRFWFAAGIEAKVEDDISKMGIKETIILSDIIYVKFSLKGVSFSFSLSFGQRNVILGEIGVTNNRQQKISLFSVFHLIGVCNIFYKDGKLFLKRKKEYTIFYLPDASLVIVDSYPEYKRVIRGEVENRAVSFTGDYETRYAILKNSFALNKKKVKFILVMGKGEREALRLISRYRTVPFKRITTERLKFYKKIGIPDPIKTTYYKALSILKANVETPQGCIKTRWTTPDRYLHRDLWFWDSALHSLGTSLISKELGEDTLRAILSIQDPNGFISHWVKPSGEKSKITQPPLLAWAAMKVSRNNTFLLEIYQAMLRYIDWVFKNRDRNKNYLLEWTRPDESGMDNSSRFNFGFSFDTVDFSSFIANELRWMVRMGRILKKDTKNLRILRQKVIKAMEMLWNDREEFYYDRLLDGRFSPIESIVGFLPLFAEAVDNKRASLLVKKLKGDFWTPFPIPSEAKDSSTNDGNMWRGPVWLNYNYFIIEGLRNYGYDRLADRIAKRTIEEVIKWYKREGTIFEFYDPYAKFSPRKLPRKDKFGAVYEYGWSSAIFMRLVREYLGPGV